MLTCWLQEQRLAVEAKALFSEEAAARLASQSQKQLPVDDDHREAEALWKSAAVVREAKERTERLKLKSQRNRLRAQVSWPL